MSCPFSGGKTAPDDPEFKEYCPGYQLQLIKFYPNFLQNKENGAFRLQIKNQPQYLIDTLFHDEQIEQIRRKPFYERLIYIDGFKSDGNKLFSSKQYEKAYINYVHGLSILRFLRIKDGITEKDIHDDNVELIEIPTNGTDEHKLDQLALVNILSNISACFLEMRCFKECKQVCNWIQRIQPDHLLSQLRKSQSVIYNLGSNVEQLNKTYKELQGINLENNYEILLSRAQQFIQMQIQTKRNIIQKIIKSGTVEDFIIPNDDQENTPKEFEHKVLEQLVERYQEMMQFYFDTSKFDKVVEIRQQLIPVQKVLAKMNFIYKLKLNDKDLQQALKDYDQDKIMILTQNFQFTKQFLIMESFSEADYNEHLLQYCIEKVQKSEQKRETKSPGIFTYSNVSVIVIIIGIFLFYYLK